MAINMRELYWAAGFMEGEGSFSSQRYLVTVQAVQVQRQPLERLQLLFGGVIRTFRRRAVIGEVYHRWEVTGRKAAAIAMTLYALMSPRRKQQIAVALEKWKAVKSWKQKIAERTHCRAGHPLSGENLYQTPRGFRQCRTCKRIYRKQYSLSHAT
jgi:hypothetical protein